MVRAIVAIHSTVLGPALGGTRFWPYDSEREALRRIRARVLLIGISSDWLFPPEDVRDLAQRIRAAGHACDYAELKSSHGHDGFLADMDQLAPFITAALWRPSGNPVPIARPHLARTANL